MQVKVETKGLERKLTVSVPTEKLEEELSSRLKDLARKAKVAGFRPGKVPLNVIKSRFSETVLEDVARDLVQPTLLEALKEKDLVPAGSPYVQPEQVESGKDFIYTATFEVFPEIHVNELEKTTQIDVIRATITDSDVDKVLEKLREQNREWKEVARPVVQGDKVIIDFQGFLGDKPFEGGEAKGSELIIGSGSMIPGFEEQLIGAEQNKPFEITLNFPKNYAHKELADQEATFKVTVQKIMEGELPALDEAFAEKFDIKEGGIEGLKKAIRKDMERELDRRLRSINREKIFNALLKINLFEIPNSLIEQEIAHLKHEMYHRIFGPEHKDNEKIPDFPRKLFENRAKHRVQLGLLLSEYLKKHELAVEKEQVDAMIDKLSDAYEKPEELRAWYRESKERMVEIETLATEELIAEKIGEHATLVEKHLSYEEVMQHKEEIEEEGA